MRNYPHNWLLAFILYLKNLYVYNMTRADDGDQRFDPKNTKPK